MKTSMTAKYAFSKLYPVLICLPLVLPLLWNGAVLAAELTSSSTASVSVNMSGTQNTTSTDVNLAAGASVTVSPITTSSTQSSFPPIKHVFIIVLENKGFDQTFGNTSPATYLKDELTSKGQLLTQYYGTGHSSLDNYITMVSGQSPNFETQADCYVYSDFVGSPSLDADGQVIGQGCVYPSTVQTIANQLVAHSLTWGAYAEDMANSTVEPKTCRHPGIGQADNTQSARMGDQYAARHNPFVYFHAITGSPACDAHDVDLSRLDTDLKQLATTPNYVFITPNLCNDGHDAPCVDGSPGGLISIDKFLQLWVPKILASPAYNRDGMLIITFDEADTRGNENDTACCNEPSGPNTPLPGITGPGGGRTGTVILSKFVKPGSVNGAPYNHYSLLRTIEDLFGLGHLGYAGQAGLSAFGPDVFNAP